MKVFLRFLTAIALSIVLLELIVLVNERNWMAFTNLRIAGITSLAFLVYHYIFEYKSRKKKG